MSDAALAPLLAFGPICQPGGDGDGDGEGDGDGDGESLNKFG